MGLHPLFRVPGEAELVVHVAKLMYCGCPGTQSTSLANQFFPLRKTFTLIFQGPYGRLFHNVSLPSETNIRICRSALPGDAGDG